ncbi:DUF5662 family protein [Plantactinospora alkalitolerans]|uniref:DUF5662 family protein n=1 Tax=Plantactinospora alkalitolerans TaxID=2789879 RepID=UPI001E376216|nr:DUF5662 family protein [Plantactinospora alkalitolerans]
MTMDAPTLDVDEGCGDPAPAYDSRADTLFHARRVGQLLDQLIKELIDRGRSHDYSKTQPPEVATFDEFTPKLTSATYGSPEYEANRVAMGSGLTAHYANNAHHPEHHDRGVLGMTLVDLAEMLADWRASTERHADGNLARSLRTNRERFNIPTGLYDVLVNTARHLGWIEPDDLPETQVDVEPAGIDPARFIEVMTANGFPESGHRSGGYVRFDWPESAPTGSVRVWVDVAAPEYEEMTGATLRELQNAAEAGRRAQAVLDALSEARPR